VSVLYLPAKGVSGCFASAVNHHLDLCKKKAKAVISSGVRSGSICRRVRGCTRVVGCDCKEILSNYSEAKLCTTLGGFQPRGGLSQSSEDEMFLFTGTFIIVRLSMDTLLVYNSALSTKGPYRVFGTPSTLNSVAAVYSSHGQPPPTTTEGGRDKDGCPFFRRGFCCAAVRSPNAENVLAASVVLRDIIGHKSELVSRDYTHVDDATKRKVILNTGYFQDPRQAINLKPPYPGCPIQDHKACAGCDLSRRALRLDQRQCSAGCLSQRPTWTGSMTRERPSSRRSISTSAFSCLADGVSTDSTS